MCNLVTLVHKIPSILRVSSFDNEKPSLDGGIIGDGRGSCWKGSLRNVMGTAYFLPYIPATAGEKFVECMLPHLLNGKSYTTLK